MSTGPVVVSARWLRGGYGVYHGGVCGGASSIALPVASLSVLPFLSLLAVLYIVVLRSALHGIPQ